MPGLVKSYSDCISHSVVNDLPFFDYLYAFVAEARKHNEVADNQFIITSIGNPETLRILATRYNAPRKPGRRLSYGFDLFLPTVKILHHDGLLLISNNPRDRLYFA